MTLCKHMHGMMALPGAMTIGTKFCEKIGKKLAVNPAQKAPCAICNCACATLSTRKSFCFEFKVKSISCLEALSKPCFISFYQARVLLSSIPLKWPRFQAHSVFSQNSRKIFPPLPAFITGNRIPA